MDDSAVQLFPSNTCESEYVVDPISETWRLKTGLELAGSNTLRDVETCHGGKPSRRILARGRESFCPDPILLASLFPTTGNQFSRHPADCDHF
jgi:hypothetical protein